MVLSEIYKTNTPGTVPEVAFRSAVCQCLCNVFPVLEEPGFLTCVEPGVWTQLSMMGSQGSCRMSAAPPEL